MLYGGWKLLVCGLSPFVNSFESMSIFLSLSFHGPSCVQLFSLFFSFFSFFYACTFMCPFFSIAHVVRITGVSDPRGGGGE